MFTLPLLVVYHLGCCPMKCATTTSEIDSMGQMRFKYAKNHNNHDVNYIENNNGYNVQVVYPQPVLVRLTWAMFNPLCHYCLLLKIVYWFVVGLLLDDCRHL